MYTTSQSLYQSITNEERVMEWIQIVSFDAVWNTEEEIQPIRIVSGEQSREEYTEEATAFYRERGDMKNYLRAKL